MRKYAYELTESDRLSHRGREVVIDEITESKADILVIGYYDDNGDDFSKVFNPNTIVDIVNRDFSRLDRLIDE